MGGPHNASRLTHCAYVNIFSHGLSGIVHLRRRSYGILFLLFRALFFRTYTSVFEKVNKTPLMFTPITSKIEHVKTNERRGYSNPTTLLS